LENREVVLVEEITPSPKGIETQYLSKKIPLIGIRNQVCGILGVSIDIGTTSNAIQRDILDKCFEIMPALTPS